MKTSNDCFKLSVTPLQISDQVSDGLIVYPGEPSQVSLQVKNLRQKQPLQLNCKVEGNFPPNWCLLSTEGNEISPAAQMDAVLYFHIPENFFEDQQVIHPGKSLQLKYHVLITVNNLEPENSQSEQVEFNLYVRPRSLYLDFLPNLYREADRDESFTRHSTDIDLIGRFLKIFEQAFEPAVYSLDAMWANLNPLTSPEAMLPFLAHWVGWTITPGWELDSQRRLMSQALELYRWRGTRRGLRLYLHAYTGLPLDDSLSNESEKQISITEAFGSGFIVGEAILGEAILGSGCPYHFNVHLRINVDHPIERIDESILHQIIQQEKPAFCTYHLTIERMDNNYKTIMPS
ncbi:MAG: phage tail protein [Cyanobacteria bacterium RM1_2_2]|nr:phage tail protein [Cyanobacteria bacterium RM1_2_2]